ncbi:MAG: hypothetical protein M3Y59_18900 [Myxococcota bacterium]|nr:hypothetical protein [Myxococcota bacterium]
MGSYRIELVEATMPLPAQGLVPEALTLYWSELICACLETGQRRTALNRRLDEVRASGTGNTQALFASRYSAKISLKTAESVVALLHELITPNAPFLCDETCPHLAFGATPVQVKRFVDSLEAAALRVWRIHQDTERDHQTFDDELDELDVYDAWRGRMYRLHGGLQPTSPRTKKPPEPSTVTPASQTAASAPSPAGVGAPPPRRPSILRERGQPPGPLTLLLAELARLRAEAAIPEAFLQGRTESPHQVPGAFDPNRLLGAGFQHLRLRDGYRLDYVWKGDHHQGSPLLYARREEEAPLESADAFAARFQVKLEGYAPRYPSAFLPAVVAPDTLGGAAELAIFVHEVPHFLWYWHARYEEVQLLLTVESRLKMLQNLDVHDRSEFLSYPTGMRGRRVEEGWEVGTLTFSEDEGVTLRLWTLAAPNRLIRVLDLVIAPCNYKRFY